MSEHEFLEKLRKEKRPMSEHEFLEQLLQERPMRRVEAFHHLDVCADWNEREALTLARKGPKPLELFYVPLIWSSMLLHPAIGKQCEEALATLGDAKDFDDARRSTWKDVMLSCCYWRHIFSG